MASGSTTNQLITKLRHPYTFEERRRLEFDPVDTIFDVKKTFTEDQIMGFLK